MIQKFFILAQTFGFRYFSVAPDNMQIGCNMQIDPDSMKAANVFQLDFGFSTVEVRFRCDQSPNPILI